MERATGFEPATSTLARLRATNCAKPASQELIYATARTIASPNLEKFFRGGKMVTEWLLKLSGEERFIKGDFSTLCGSTDTDPRQWQPRSLPRQRVCVG